MTDGIPGLLLNLSVVLGMTAIFIAFILGMAHRFFLEVIAQFQPKVQEIFLWLCAFLPILIGLYAIFVAEMPSMSHELGLTSDHCHSESVNHYLCVYFPPAFNWLSWPGIFLFSFFAFIAAKLCVGFYRAYQHQSYLSTLLSFIESKENDIYLLDSHIPNAFTLGLIRPQVIVSKALCHQLTPDELDIVYKHELAHKKTHDPLRLWLFSLILSFHLPHVRRSFYKAMEISLEKKADAEVLALRNDSELIASTLIKVNRLTNRFFSQAVVANFCHFGKTAIEQRVAYLLASDKGRAFPCLLTSISFSIFIIIGVSGADLFHHAIENIFNFI